MLPSVVERFSVVLLDSSASSCRGGRGWIDMEGGANFDDCDRRLSPALLAKEGWGGDAGAAVGTGGGGWFGRAGTTLP